MLRCMQMVWALLVVTIPFGLFAQNESGGFESPGKGVVAGRKLQISSNKTSLLVFPAAIQSADRGEGYVLAERVKDAENVLKVKAGKDGFAPSSLSVITADGKVYVFRVFYSEDPPGLVQDFRGERSGGTAVQFKGQSLNSAELLAGAESVRASAPFLKSVQCRQYGLRFKLGGIFIQRDVLYLKFRLWNTSAVSYRLSSLNFFIRDLKIARRTAIQDNEVRSLYMHTWGVPEDKYGQVIVVALPRFTIADKKKLSIELMEQDGDRALSLDLRERKFRKAKNLYQQ